MIFSITFFRKNKRENTLPNSREVSGTALSSGFKSGIYLIVLTSLFLSLESCNESRPESLKQTTVNQDSLDEIKRRVIPPVETFPEIKYHLIKIHSNAQRNRILDSLKNVPNFSEAALKLLNRKEFRFISSSQEIVIPDVFYTDTRAYSIFPPYYSGAKDIEKFIIVSAHYQCMALYEWGVLVKFNAVNSGKERTPSYPGRYSLTFRQLERHSSIDSTWIMKYYFNFHPEAGMAFHQFTMPGYPASHSCMRMFLEDAIHLYSWGKGAKVDTNKIRIPLSGTPVVVLDYYPFGIEYRPWMNISSNRSVSLNLPSNPMKVEEPLIPIIQIPSEVRGMLRNRQRFIFAEDSLRKLGVIREGVTLTPSINYNKQRRIKKAKALEEKRKAEMLQNENNLLEN